MRRQVYCAKNWSKRFNRVIFLALIGVSCLQAGQDHCSYDLKALTIENLLNSMTKSPCAPSKKNFAGEEEAVSFSQPTSVHGISYLISFPSFEGHGSPQCCGFLSSLQPCSRFEEQSFCLKGVIGDPGHPSQVKSPMLVYGSTDHFWQHTLHRISFTSPQNSVKGRVSVNQTTFFFPSHNLVLQRF